MDSPQPAPDISFRGLSSEELALLNDEIAALAKSNLPLDQGLASLGEEMTRGRMRTVTLKLAADMQTGISLPDAMAKQEANIPRYYGRMVAAGIRTGNVAEVLATLATYGRSLAEIQWSVVSALLYPAMLFVISIGLMIFLCLVIMPQFEAIFENFRIRLPIMTEVVLFISRNWIWIFVVPSVSMLLLFLVARTLLKRTEAGRARWARFIYALPIVGSLIQRARLAAFVDLLSLLVRRQVPLPEAFALAGEAAADPVLRLGSRLVNEDLKHGQALGESLASRKLIPRSAAWMISIAERNGNLADALANLAQMYRTSVQLRTRLVGTVLPPALVLCVGAVVAIFFVFGVAAPMVSLLEGLSGGF
ncbi:MAG: type II secretion system F family protein [Gemmataceae bacterium]